MVQHSAARFSLNDYSRLSPGSPMIDQFGWDTLEKRRLLSQLTMLYKIQQGLMGISLPPEVFPLDWASHLPNCTPQRHIQCNCNVYKFSFYPRSIVVWNQLCLNTLPLQSISAFRSEIFPIRYMAKFYLKYALFISLCIY